MDKTKSDIIKKRIEKLGQDDFDLDAWKETTASVVEKVVGMGDSRIKHLQELKVDYGSWALRDATSKYNPLETAKRKGKEILESILDEQELSNPLQRLSTILTEESLHALKTSKSKETLLKALKKEKKDSLAEALAAILSL